MLGRILFSVITGMVLGALPALPLFLISSFVDDRPNLWFWPLFGGVFTIVIFFSPAAKGEKK
jgi:hypothetical protein